MKKINLLILLTVAIAIAIAVFAVGDSQADFGIESFSLNKGDVYKYGLKSVK